MKTDSRKHGTTMVEILIAMLVFSLGIGTIAATMVYGLQTILNSQKALVTDQIMSNSVEEYLLRRTIDHSVSLAAQTLEGGKIDPVTTATPKSFTLCGKPMKFKVYRFIMDNKSAPIYILERD